MPRLPALHRRQAYAVCASLTADGDFRQPGLRYRGPDGGAVFPRASRPTARQAAPRNGGGQWPGPPGDGLRSRPQDAAPVPSFRTPLDDAPDEQATDNLYRRMQAVETRCCELWGGADQTADMRGLG